MQTMNVDLHTPFADRKGMSGKVRVLYGGELAAEVAEKIVSGASVKGVEVEAINMSEFKKAKLGEEAMTVIFVIQVSFFALPTLPTSHPCTVLVPALVTDADSAGLPDGGE